MYNVDKKGSVLSMLKFKKVSQSSFPQLEYFSGHFHPISETASTSVTSRALFERLSKADVNRVMKKFDAEDKMLWRELHDDLRGQRLVLLHLAAYYRDETAMRKTGLTTAMPTEDVHSMARGKLSAGGSHYYADLVMGVLESAAITLPKQAKVLDFGCSSGRVLRVLHAYRPDIVAHGCDVNKEAIKWASKELMGMFFGVSPLRPPLPYKKHMFDMAYAISMWSHFNESTATAWLDEMHRIIKPGGVLLLTIHGPQSVHFLNKVKAHDETALDATVGKLLTDGFYFVDRFGDTGDWGVVDNDWGDAFMSLSWLAARVSPKWEVLSYTPGNVEGNQDTVLLRAR